jgi:hypothetical protein
MELASTEDIKILEEIGFRPVGTCSRKSESERDKDKHHRLVDIPVKRANQNKKPYNPDDYVELIKIEEHSGQKFEQRAGVYAFVVNGKICYVGSSRNIRRRMYNYANFGMPQCRKIRGKILDELHKHGVVEVWVVYQEPISKVGSIVEEVKKHLALPRGYLAAEDYLIGKAYPSPSDRINILYVMGFAARPIARSARKAA